MVCKFIIGGEKRMSLAVSFDLCGLNQRLHACAQIGQLFGQRTAIKVGHCEHASVTEVAVVGNGQYLCAGFS